MTRNEIVIELPPAAVWAVFADPRLYASWVAPASTVRRVDGVWPEPGSAFHHTQLGLLRDCTEVLGREDDRFLHLRANVRPFLISEIRLHLEASSGGCRVVMEETVTGGAGAVLPGSPVDPMLSVRNAVSLRRLRNLAEIGAALGQRRGG